MWAIIGLICLWGIFLTSLVAQQREVLNSLDARVKVSTNPGFILSMEPSAPMGYYTVDIPLVWRVEIKENIPLDNPAYDIALYGYLGLRPLNAPSVVACPNDSTRAFPSILMGKGGYWFTISSAHNEALDQAIANPGTPAIFVSNALRQEFYNNHATLGADAIIQDPNLGGQNANNPFRWEINDNGADYNVTYQLLKLTNDKTLVFYNIGTTRDLLFTVYYASYAPDLNRGIVSSALRRQFANNGITLSENATAIKFNIPGVDVEYWRIDSYTLQANLAGFGIPKNKYIYVSSSEKPFAGFLQGGDVMHELHNLDACVKTYV